MLDISPALKRDMESKGIDVALSKAILDDYNAGFYDAIPPIRAAGVPLIDGSTVVDLRSSNRPNATIFSFDAAKAIENLAAFGIVLPAGVKAAGETKGNQVAFTSSMLLNIGMEILSFTAFGVLNGGSATSYADGKKNLALGKDVFDAVSSSFAILAPLCKDLPKGITPAYINPDGSPGASFLELKMRARLLLAEKAALSRQKATERRGIYQKKSEFLPLFQMTSGSTDAFLRRYYEDIVSSPLLRTLAADMDMDAAPWRTGVQPMISAYSHSSEGRPKHIFDAAYGKKDSCLPLPGGHGQCFRVLSSVFTTLHDEGIRYACLGNVDNLAYTPDPIELAIMAISGQPAAFDFAIRTPMDVKGGILVEDARGRRTIADIGPAIAFDEVIELERKGFSILFNCASGIFDLDYLVPKIEEIARQLPVRFSDQDKDSGKYSQAEQVAWEISSLLPSFIAFAVEKKERFLAAKLLIDTLLTSGVGAASPSIPADVRETAKTLHGGLESALRHLYGLELSGNRWLAQELIAQ
ncbi:MAG: UTP--glucose-1-phosphate uridylyltransferase [Spirochaetales bacterium]|jgi:UDP-N-acetylglucosamine pyrophosphorylase